MPPSPVPPAVSSAVRSVSICRIRHSWKDIFTKGNSSVKCSFNSIQPFPAAPGILHRLCQPCHNAFICIAHIDSSLNQALFQQIDHFSDLITLRPGQIPSSNPKCAHFLINSSVCMKVLVIYCFLNLIIYPII